MLTNQLVEDGENYYYVDANGAMVKNTWVAIAADEDEEEDVDYRWYYFGTNDDGARHSGWLRYEDGFDNTDYDDLDYEYYWFWFGSNGEKRTTPKKINGHYYNFNEDGIMLTEWAGETPGDTTKSKYYNANLENGSLEKNAWVWAEPDENWEIYEDDSDEHWFRTDNKGEIISDQTKKINSKWYVFDNWGRMQYGLVLLADKDTDEPAYKVSGSKIDTAVVRDADGNEVDGISNGIIDEDVAEASDIYATDGNLFYFSDNEETDGAMKTGSSITISLADDDYVFGFTKTTGEAFCGVENNKVYRNGIRQEADDDKYAIVLGGKGDQVVPYLVNSTGTMMKDKKYYKDDNDEYYVVLSGDKNNGFEIVKGIDCLDLAKELRDAANDNEDMTVEDAEAIIEDHDCGNHN